MSTLKVTNLRHSSASSDAITLASDGTATAKTTNRQGRNLIINGACLIAQRATSSTSHGYSTVDRLKPYETGTDCGTKTWSQSDVAAGNDCYNAGFRKAFKVTTSQAGNTSTASDMFKHWATRIEAQDIAGSGWKYTDPNSKLALSFWIKASTADNFQVQLQSHDGTNKKFNFVAPATTSWTKITKIIPGHADLQFDNDTGEGLEISLMIAAGADFAGSVTQETWVANTVAFLNSSQINTWIAAGAGNVETTGWQLEVGDVVTDYEHRTYHDELLRCKRYYQLLATGTSQVVAMGYIEQGAGDVNAARQLVPAMRATPSIDDQTSGSTRYRVNSGGDSNTGNAMGINSSYSSENLVWLQLGGLSGVTASQGAQIRKQTSSARLGVAAEL